MHRLVHYIQRMPTDVPNWKNWLAQNQDYMYAANAAIDLFRRPWTVEDRAMFDGMTYNEIVTYFREQYSARAKRRSRYRD